MLKTLFLAAGCTLVIGAATAQTTAPEPAGKVKVKTKRQRGNDAAPATTPAGPATDYSVPYAASITPDGLKQDLSVLASDAYEGRETGQKGQKMAADYIAKAFAADGLAGPVAGSDNPYLQHFTLSKNALDPASTITVGGRTFTAGKDFYVFLQNPAAATGSLPLAFVGYGISTPTYADFSAQNPALKGKALVLLLGEPHTAAGKPVLGQGGAGSPYGRAGYPELSARSPAFRPLAPVATFRITPNAEAFANVPKDYPGLFDRTSLTFGGAADGERKGSNIFIVSPELGAALLGTNAAGLARYRQAAAVGGKPAPSPFKPGAATLAVKEQATPVGTENVLGYLEGSDKKDEVLVLSAHYDHEGIKDGKVYNGADDDGSGTVSILAMARAFTQAKHDGHGPRRSILFLANTGEEEGLLGSQYYTDHPIYPLANTVTDLNIDMVGRVDSLHQGKGDYVYVIGDDKLSSELHTVSEAANQQYQPLAIDYTYNDPNDPQHLYYRSDHYNFAKHRVPVAFYTSGLHPDYHQPTDDVDKIDFPAMARRDQLIFHTAWAVANRDTRPTVDKGFQPTAADLARYAGTYASPQIPLVITITQDGTGLQAQANGQPAFGLEAVSEGNFTFAPAGIFMKFDPTKPTFQLQQGGQSFEFTKK